MLIKCKLTIHRGKNEGRKMKRKRIGEENKGVKLSENQSLRINEASYHPGLQIVCQVLNERPAQLILVTALTDVALSYCMTITAKVESPTERPHCIHHLWHFTRTHREEEKNHLRTALNFAGRSLRNELCLAIAAHQRSDDVCSLENESQLEKSIEWANISEQAETFFNYRHRRWDKLFIYV